MSSVNTMFGRIVEDGEVEFAPSSLTLGGILIVNPSSDMYTKFGYDPISDVPPETESGFHAEPTGWRKTDAGIERVYTVVADAKKNRTFSKLKCVVVLKTMGAWEKVRDWIEANGLMDLYLAAQVFKEDNPYFVKGRSELQKVLSVDDDGMEKILEQCLFE